MTLSCIQHIVLCIPQTVIEHLIQLVTPRDFCRVWMQFHLANERIEADFLLLFSIVMPDKIHDEWGDEISRFEHSAHDVPTCTTDGVLRFALTRLDLRSEVTCCALHITEGIGDGQEREWFGTVGASHQPDDILFTAVPC